MTMVGRARAKLVHPGAQPDCERCGGSGTELVPGGERVEARICACVDGCPACRGSGFVADSADRLAPHRRCACRLVEMRHQVVSAAEIPARHAHSRFQTFIVGNHHQAVVLDAVTRYIDEFRPTEPDNRGLVLYGDVGRGKTHLLCAMLRELALAYGVGVRFIEFSHLVAEIKSGFDLGRGAGSLIRDLVHVDVLAIDELGKGRNTEWEGTVLDELISKRYNAMKPILATTNYRPGSTGTAVGNAAAVLTGTGTSPGLADRVGDRVYSRLRETCDFVEIVGEDYREKRGRA